MPSERASRMAEDYLQLLWKTEEWPGTPMGTNELASILGVTPPSVSANLKKLARDGYIDYEPYGRVALLEPGREVAVAMVRRHRLIETYLAEQLGLDWDQVHDEADLLEHAVSDLVLDRIDRVLGQPTHDPHGDAIPGPNGELPATRGERLYDLPVGGEAEVVRVSDRDADLLRYLSELGIRVGARLRTVARRDYAGSVSVDLLDSSARTDGSATPVRLELANVAANSIWGIPVS